MDLASSNQKTEQSSVYKDHSALKAVDNNDETCAETVVQNHTWWQSMLEGSYIVHTVVLKTGVAFGCKLNGCLFDIINSWNL